MQESARNQWTRARDTRLSNTSQRLTSVLLARLVINTCLHTTHVFAPPPPTSVHVCTRAGIGVVLSRRRTLLLILFWGPRCTVSKQAKRRRLRLCDAAIGRRYHSLECQLLLVDKLQRSSRMATKKKTKTHTHTQRKKEKEKTPTFRSLRTLLNRAIQSDVQWCAKADGTESPNTCQFQDQKAFLGCVRAFLFSDHKTVITNLDRENTGWVWDDWQRRQQAEERQCIGSAPGPGTSHYHEHFSVT